MKIYFVVIGLAFFVLLAIVVAAFFPSLFPLANELTLSDRINLVALAVNIVGFGLAIYTGWFAAQQFIQSQIKPDLFVSMEGGSSSIEMQRFDIARDAPLPIYVNNSGQGVGRFISIYINFTPGLDVSLDGTDTENNRWRLHYNPDNDQYIAHYVGANEFICYKNFPLYVGKVRIHIDGKGEHMNYSCEWKTLAENMSVKEGTLLIKMASRE